MRLALVGIFVGLGGLVGVTGRVDADPILPALEIAVAASPTGVPDVRCAGAPDAGGELRHFKSRLIALGDAEHRGDDLIAVDGEPQTLAGKLHYGLVDKALEDEDVVVFACEPAGWRALGTTRTDEDGRFALALRERLPIGLRDIYAAVRGDASGARFLAYVAPAGARLIVSDVDGTLTSSENAFPKAVLFGGDVGAQPDAAAAFRAAAAAGYQLVYVTARGDRFTAATRDWLGRQGFPRGPLRLAPGLLTLPGSSTIAFKTQVLRALRGFAIAAGIGNRASDVVAYRAAGVPSDRIFVKLPEFAGELARQQAIGFAAYGEVALPR